MRRATRFALLLVIITPAFAHADMGPQFRQPRINVYIIRQGKPLTAPFETLLLRPEGAVRTPAGTLERHTVAGLGEGHQ